MTTEMLPPEFPTVQTIIDSDAGPEAPPPLRESAPRTFGLADVPRLAMLGITGADRTTISEWRPMS